MNKKTYSKPIVEIEKFRMFDVMTVSGTEEGNVPDELDELNLFDLFSGEENPLV